MTIYTSTTVEKKDNNDVEAPKVILEDIPDLKLKVATVGTDEADAFLHNNPDNELLLIRLRQRKRRNVLYLLFLLGAMLTITLGVISAMKIYRYYYMQQREYHGVCGLTYTDDQGYMYEFQQDIRTDARTYEQIEVPQIDSFNRAIILHDFAVNYTAIVDRDNSRCFLKPLNRSLVKPPVDFWDLISKLRSGYYLPDEREVRENFRVVQPPVYDLSPYGDYIWSACSMRHTYRIERIDQAMAIVKRSVCNAFTVRHSTGIAVDVMKILSDC